ncbi:hypothetical protein CBS9595_000156 [Malassezia furfur]|nr:hypothetical protein CBS9595_000156 [Malassezia furfur]
MYVLAPAVSTRWLNIPFNALRGERWPSPSTLTQAIDSSYIMISIELRQALLYRAGDSASRWSLAALATATMLTSAMALYYYVPWGQLELNMEHILSSIGSEGFGSVTEYSSESYDEEDHDDDEHVDPELLDGFQSDGKDQVVSVVLTSSDPSSDLCHKPIVMDLSEHASRSRSIQCISPVSRSQSPGKENSPCAPEQRRQSVPSILKRDSQSFPSQPLGNPNLLEHSSPRRARRRLHSHTGSPSPLSRLLPMSDDSDMSSSTDSLPSCLSTPCKDLRNGTVTPRSVVLKEPDWTPFVDSHDRARKRVMMASIANAMNELHSEKGSPIEKSKQLPILEALPIEPPAELGDGGEFWFERFTRSTAAAGKHWDWRRRSSSDLVELLDDNVLATLENYTVQTREEKGCLFAPTNTKAAPAACSPASPTFANESRVQPPSFSMASCMDASAECSSPTRLTDAARPESSPSRSEFCFTPTKRKFDLDWDRTESASTPMALGLGSPTRAHAHERPLERPESPFGSMSPPRLGVERITAPLAGRASIAKRRLKDKFTGRFGLALVDS